MKKRIKSAYKEMKDFPVSALGVAEYLGLEIKQGEFEGGILAVLDNDCIAIAPGKRERDERFATALCVAAFLEGKGYYVVGRTGLYQRDEDRIHIGARHILFPKHLWKKDKDMSLKQLANKANVSPPVVLGQPRLWEQRRVKVEWWVMLCLLLVLFVIGVTGFHF
jgi:hypothetical protein